MNVARAIAFLILMRIPVVRDLPFVQRLDTIDQAIDTLTKAAQRLENVAEREILAAAGKRRAASDLIAAAANHDVTAERAKRVATNITKLTA